VSRRVTAEEAANASYAELMAMQEAGDLPGLDGKPRRTNADRAKNYQTRREALIAKLGGKCVVKGCTNTDLELDHIGPTRDWRASDKPRWVRIKLYEQEAERGELQLLCGDHNKRKGKPKRRRAS